MKIRRVGLLVLVAVVATTTPIGPATGDPAEGSPPLTVELIDRGCVYGQFSPDSLYWVCLDADDDIPGDELYAVPLDGSTPPIRLSPELGTPEDAVTWFEITPDGGTVVFAHGPNAGSYDILGRAIYSVPIAGGPVTALTPLVEAGDLIWHPDLAPDGSRIALFWYGETAGAAGLYSMKLDGTDLIEIDPIDPWFLITEEQGKSPTWEWDIFTPDPGWLHYRAVQSHLYTVPSLGGTPTRVTGDNSANGDLHDYWFTPDVSHIVYVADHDTNGMPEIYASPVAGGGTIKLNASLEAGQYVVDQVAFLPDSSAVVYGIAGESSSDAPVWHLAPMDGGLSTEVTDGLWPVHITNDSSMMIVASPEVTAYPLDGGEPTRLGDHGTALLSPDSSLVWLWQDAGNFADSQLYTTPVSGGELTLRPGATLGDSGGFIHPDNRMYFSPDSRWLVYADYSGSRSDLWAVPRDGDGTAFLVSDNVYVLPTQNSTDSGIWVSPDSTHVVYAADRGEGLRTYSTLLTRYPDAIDVQWSVDESTSIGASLGFVEATDPDGDGLSYSAQADIIDVDPSTGEVTIAETLDYETQTRHDVTVDIGDGLVTTTVTVTIDVGNVNDNDPVADGLNVSIAEDAGVGTDVGNVTATDADGDNISFSLTEPSEVFDVAADGAVTLVGQLDYEVQSLHEFTVEASDGIHTDTATVEVTVTDVDETPATSSTTTTTTTSTTTTTTLPPEPPPDPGFGDVPGSNVFHDDITWLADSGITKGCNPPVSDLYCPDDYVTRAQMAAFLHRALEDTLIATSEPIDFRDDDNIVFETDIEWLSATGVTRGCNPPVNDLFCSDDYVTRAQMAAFLDRALDLDEPPVPDLFTDDDGSPFEESIDRLATAGITKGCNPPTNTLFCPNDYVTRAQMAAFLHRALGN